MTMKRTLLALAALLSLTSCRYVSSFLREGDVVARIGSHKLYSDDLEAYVPKGLSPEDSASLAQQYIRTWAMDRMFEEVARKELSKADLDVSKELDDYRSSLLKYRYEQSYINHRLDTAISDAVIEEYYDTHREQFRLPQPIVKARFVAIRRDSPTYAAVKNELSVEDEDGMVAADSLIVMNTVRNTSFGGSWTEASALAREFGTDYATMFMKMNGNYIEMVDDEGNAGLAYIYDMMDAGRVGPQEFYRDRIRDIILSARKQALLSELERELLEAVRKRDNYVEF